MTCSEYNETYAKLVMLKGVALIVLITVALFGENLDSPYYGPFSIAATIVIVRFVIMAVINPIEVIRNHFVFSYQKELLILSPLVDFVYGLVVSVIIGDFKVLLIMSVYVLLYYVFIDNRWAVNVFSSIKGTRKYRNIELKRAYGLSIDTQVKLVNLNKSKTEEFIGVLEDSRPLNSKEVAVIENGLEILENSSKTVESYSGIEEEFFKSLDLIVHKIEEELSSEKKERIEVSEEVNAIALQEMKAVSQLLND